MESTNAMTEISALNDRITAIREEIDGLTNRLLGLSLTVSVLDGEGGAVLHVYSDSASLSDSTNYLVLTITNTSSAPVTINALSGTPSSGNANLTINFTDDSFYFGYPTSSYLTLSDVMLNGTAIGNWQDYWQLAWPASDSSYINALYLATSQGVTLEPSDTLTIDIQYSGAFPDDPTAVTTQVTVGYQNMTWSGGNVQGTTPQQTLVLSTKVGLPQPLVAQFAGPRTVLNDGTTPRALTLCILNTSADPVLLIAPPQGKPTPSGIDVVLPASVSAGSNPPTLGGTAANGWSATQPANAPGTFTLTPDYATTQSIPAGGTLNVTFNNVTSSSAPGMAQVTVTFRSFVLYGTQTVGVALETTPLIYGDGLGTGMTLAAGSLGSNVGLAVTGDTSASVVSVTQSGSGTALALTGGTGSALTVDGGAGVQINPSANSPGLAVTGTNTSALATIAQGGTGSALLLTGGANCSSPLLTVNQSGPSQALAVTGATSLASLDVSGTTSLGGSLGVSGNASLSGNLSVSGNVSVGPVASSNALTVNGTAAIGTDLPQSPTSLLVSNNNTGGAGVHWNLTGRNGETDFVNFTPEGPPNAFQFYNITISRNTYSPLPSNLRPLVTISQAGNVIIQGNIIIQGKGGRTYLATLDSSNGWFDSSVFSSNPYQYYELVFNNIVPGTNQDRSFGAQFYMNNNWASENTYYYCAYGNDNGGNAAESGQQSYLRLWPANRAGPGNGAGLFGQMTLFNPTGTGFNKSYRALVYAPYAYTQHGCQGWIAGNYAGSTDAVSGIRFSFFNESISSGSVDIYGWN